MHCQPADSVKHHKAQRSHRGSKHRQNEEDLGLNPGTLQCLEFGKMKHSDRKVKKERYREGVSSKEGSKLGAAAPKPSEENDSRKRESSPESSTINSESLAIVFSYINVPRYIDEIYFNGVAIVRVLRNHRWSRFKAR